MSRARAFALSFSLTLSTRFALPPTLTLSRVCVLADSASENTHGPRKYLSRYPRISANILRDAVSWSLAPTAKVDHPLRLIPPPTPVGSTSTRRHTTTVQYLYYPNRTLSGNTDMIAIPFIYLQLYGRARLYTTLGTYQNRRPPCNTGTDDAIIIFSDKPTIPSLSYPSRFAAVHGRLQYATTFCSWTTRNASRTN